MAHGAVHKSRLCGFRATAAHFSRIRGKFTNGLVTAKDYIAASRRCNIDTATGLDGKCELPPGCEPFPEADRMQRLHKAAFLAAENLLTHCCQSLSAEDAHSLLRKAMEDDDTAAGSEVPHDDDMAMQDGDSEDEGDLADPGASETIASSLGDVLQHCADSQALEAAAAAPSDARHPEADSSGGAPHVDFGVLWESRRQGPCSDDLWKPIFDLLEHPREKTAESGLGATLALLAAAARPALLHTRDMEGFLRLKGDQAGGAGKNDHNVLSAALAQTRLIHDAAHGGQRGSRMDGWRNSAGAIATRVQRHVMLNSKCTTKAEAAEAFHAPVQFWPWAARPGEPGQRLPQIVAVSSEVAKARGQAGAFAAMVLSVWEAPVQRRAPGAGAEQKSTRSSARLTQRPGPLAAEMAGRLRVQVVQFCSYPGRRLAPVLGAAAVHVLDVRAVLGACEVESFTHRQDGFSVASCPRQVPPPCPPST